jgi:predicted transport protein
MSDIKLFRINKGAVEELSGGPVKLEKNLQRLLEEHLDEFLRVRFLATEYSTGKTHGGRIDTLGLDENGCPTIIEYKRNSNANVINQGLFYLDWLMDHQAEFELLVLKKFGEDDANKIDWSAPRLMCMAEDFTRYDTHAVQQINRNIELIRYVRFGDDLLLLNLVNAVVAAPGKVDVGTVTDSASKEAKQYTTQAEYLEKASDELKNLYAAARDFLTSLGDDTQERILKWYIAFKRLKNFACIQLHTQKSYLIMWLSIDPDTVKLEDGFSRDVRGVGHHGTGDLELTIKDVDDLEKAKPLIIRSFEGR